MRNLPKDLAVVATALLLTGSLASVMQPPEHKDSVKATTKQIKTVSKATSTVVEAPKPPEPVLPTPAPVVAPAPSPAPVAPPPAPVANNAAAIGQQMNANKFGDSQWNCLNILWGTKESGWNVYADNPYSDAYGIPQALPGSKMASHGADWATNPRTQIAWGLDYIANRYGNPCGALAFHRNNNWY